MTTDDETCTPVVGVDWNGPQLSYIPSCGATACCCAACTAEAACDRWMTIDALHGASKPGCYLFRAGGAKGTAYPGYAYGPAPAPHVATSKYDELWRPRFHYFAAPHMMDPAAIFEANGLWHLFHDAFRDPLVEIPEWSHATSPDAVHWTKHKVAVPRGVPGACDEMFAETGGVGVRDDGAAVAIYAGGTRTNGSTVCNICASVSTDPEHMVWTKVRGLVIPNPSPGGDWRDSTRPFRLPGDASNWWIVVGTSGDFGGTPPAAKAALFVNRDGTMLHWDAAGTFFEDPRYHMMECPDAFPLSNRTDADAPFLFMASATVGAGTSVGPHWWVGTVDRSNPLAPKLRPAAQGIWDWGAQGPGDPMLDAAALPTSTSTKTGPAVGGSPRYVFSWVRGDGAFGTQWWAQHLSFNGVSAFPRAFSASDAGIRQSFIPALASLRQQEHSAQMCLPAGGATAVAGANGRALELLATFGPSATCAQGTAPAGFGLTVLAGCNASGACEATHVGYSADAGGSVFVDRTNSTTFAMGVPKLLVQKAPLHVSGTGTLRLHALLDYSVLEVIGDNGTHSAAITSRSYPVGSTSDGVRLWARGSRQHVDLKAWNLRGVQCEQTLSDVCGVGARGVAGQSCAVCCGTHQHDLRSAGCTSSDCDEFCSRAVNWM